jgi:methyltransferase (TIGR00027 family)
VREGRASKTAEQNALLRAIPWTGADGRPVCEDPFARRFLRRPLSLAGAWAVVPGLGRVVPWFIDRRWPGVRSSVVARTRLIDDALARALAEQRFAQLAILGAGFDSRAYRLPGLREVAVFEVDHPATQAAKRAVLARVLAAPPGHVRFVPVDFARDDLGAALAAAGYDPRAPSFLLWEGVTNYLTAPAVDATLRWCARAAPGSRLLFTYVHRDILSRPEVFAGSRHLQASLERVGERFTFGLDPDELPAYLADRGLGLESDVPAAEYRERYFGAAARSMRGHEFYRVATARVGA